MLTKDDLEQIGKLLEVEHEHTRKLVSDEIKTSVKQLSRKINRVQKDIKLILKYHDENVIHLRGRIERLEEHTGIPHPHRN